MTESKIEKLVLELRKNLTDKEIEALLTELSKELLIEKSTMARFSKPNEPKVCPCCQRLL